MSASAKRPFRIAAVHCFTAALLLTSTQALAEELLERVVVRNRLYRVAGRFEISPTIGFSLVDRLTSHINLTLGLGYHFSDSWALELRAGYAFSGHTSLADQVAADFLQKNIQLVDDLSSLWEMKGSAVLGVRWSPIYGKISLLAEVPVHFQTYVWLGGGVGSFHRQSVVYCEQLSGSGPGDYHCGGWLTQNRIGGLGSAAFGFRFFTGQGGAVMLEFRDYLFADSYLTGIEKLVAGSGGQTGVPAKSPGLINLVLFDVGYAFFL